MYHCNCNCGPPHITSVKCCRCSPVIISCFSLPPSADGLRSAGSRTARWMSFTRQRVKDRLTPNSNSGGATDPVPVRKRDASADCSRLTLTPECRPQTPPAPGRHCGVLDSAPAMANVHRTQHLLDRTLNTYQTRILNRQNTTDRPTSIPFPSRHTQCIVYTGL